MRQHAYLEQAFTEQQLYDLLKNGQEAAVVHANAALQGRQHVHQLGQPPAKQHSSDPPQCHANILLLGGESPAWAVCTWT
jgi:hypothetical protein